MKDQTMMGGANSKKKLTNGTTSTAKKMTDTLKARDLCHILKACKETGVKSLTWEGISVEFNLQAYSPQNQSGESPLADQPTLSTPTGNSSTENGSSTEQMRPVDQEAFEEMRLTQLLMDDPEAYEEEMIRDDIENERARGVALEETNDRRVEQDLSGRRRG